MDVSKRMYGKSMGKIGISVLKCWVKNSIFQNTFPVIDFYCFDIYLLLLHLYYIFYSSIRNTSKTPTRLSTKLVRLIFTNLQGAILSVELMPFLYTNTILLDTFIYIHCRTFRLLQDSIQICNYQIYTSLLSKFLNIVKVLKYIHFFPAINTPNTFYSYFKNNDRLTFLIKNIVNCIISSAFVYIGPYLLLSRL